MEARYKVVFIVIAAIAAVIGALGIGDLGNAPYAGYFSGPDNSVTRVFPGSPAEDAGLQVGDVLVSVGGVSVADTATLARRQRAEVGETRAFVVSRGGEERELALTYSGLPSVNRATAWLGFAIGLCFLGFPLWAYIKAPSRASLVLALFGLCFGIAFTPGPYSPSYFLRTLGGATATTVVILGFAFLVNFVLLMPRSRPFLSRPAAPKALYWPAILLAVFFLYLTVFTPDATPAFNRVIGLLVGVFIVGFFGWAVVAMIQNFARASAAERKDYGLTLMLAGTLLGLVPITFGNLVNAVAPAVGANLPGVRFYFLTLGLIPLTYALAASKMPQTD